MAYAEIELQGRLELIGTPVPEPPTIGMLGIGGLMGLAVAHSRFVKRKDN